MAGYELIRKELARINVNSRSREKNMAELGATIERFHGQMYEVLDSEFKSAIDLYTRESPWFPTVKEIIDCVKRIRQKAALDKKYLPPPELTAAQIAENIRRCRKIKEIIRNKSKEV